MGRTKYVLFVFNSASDMICATLLKRLQANDLNQNVNISWDMCQKNKSVSMMHEITLYYKKQENNNLIYFIM